MLKSFYSRVYRTILQHNAAETCSFSAWTELLNITYASCTSHRFCQIWRDDRVLCSSTQRRHHSIVFSGKKTTTVCSTEIVPFLKVALSQKILESFYVSDINIPNHYPDQKIWISCWLFWAVNSNFLLRIVIWNIYVGD